MRTLDTPSIWAEGPFERVECDAHKLHARVVFLLPLRMIHGLWVIVLIEMASRVVFGYYLSLRRECSAEDVPRAVRYALTQWTPRDPQFRDAAYVPGAGLPSHRFP